MGRLEGRVALITGAGNGQGREVARLFVEEGAKVVVTDVDEAAGQATAGELGNQAIFQTLDVTRYEAWVQAVSQTLANFGKLDVLVNNAGVNVAAYIEDMPVEDYMKVIAVNQVGPWMGMKAVIPAMRAAGGGSIINNISISALSGIGGKSAYVSSKHAERGMSLSAAGELGRYGIRVNMVHPAGIATEMFHSQVRAGILSNDRSAVPLGRMGTTREIALAMVYLASDESSYCTGAEIVVDGGMRAVLPVKANPQRPSGTS